MNMIRKFLKDENAATAIEYGLIAAGISLAIIAVVNGLGTNVKNKFTSINTSLKSNSSAAIAAFKLVVFRLRNGLLPDVEACQAIRDGGE